MNPLSTKKMIAEYSKLNNIDPELVEAVVHTYWKEVKKHLTSLDHTSVYVDYLGTFEVVSSKMRQRIQSLNHQLDKTAPTSFRSFATYDRLKDVRDKMQILHDRFEIQKQEIRERRNENRQKRINERLARNQNIDGNLEQNLPK